VRERDRKPCQLTILTGFIPYKQELDCENIKNEHRFSTWKFKSLKSKTLLISIITVIFQTTKRKWTLPQSKIYLVEDVVENNEKITLNPLQQTLMISTRKLIAC